MPTARSLTMTDDNVSMQAFLHSLRFKLQRNGARLVTNIGVDRRIDLLA